MSKQKSYNPYILAIVLALLSIGLIMIFSASGIYTFQFVLKQLVWAILGIFSMLFFSKYDYEKLKTIIMPLLVFTILLLISVLVFGTVVSGAKRWLRLGPLSFQPSEIAKITVIIFLAWYIDRKASKMKNFKDGLLKPLIIIVIILLLIFLERDFGIPFLIFVITVFLLIAGGSNLLYVAYAGLASIPVMIFVIIKEPYRLRRMTTFLHPLADPQGSGWQLSQSLIALGSGGFSGVGLGQSRTKMLFLPESHTDFIFPIIGEEFGFVGTMIILLLFCALFMLGIRIALNAKNLFGSLLAFGITIMIAFQMIINIAVSIGIFPTKGLSLPFISFGGTSILVMFTGIGILLNIGKQLKNNEN